MQGIHAISAECFNPQNPDNVLADKEATGIALFIIRSKLILFIMNRIEEINNQTLSEASVILGSPPRPISPAYEATLSPRPLAAVPKDIVRHFKFYK